MIELSVLGMGLVPVVVGIVAGIRLAIANKKVASRYAPLISFAVATVLVYLVPDAAVAGSVILGGLMIGLAASGLYSGAKALFG